MAFLDDMEELTLSEQIRDVLNDLGDINILSHTNDELFSMAEAIDNIREIINRYEEVSGWNQS